MIGSPEVSAVGWDPPTPEKDSNVTVVESLGSRARRFGARLYERLNVMAEDSLDVLEAENDEFTKETEEIAEKILKISQGMEGLWSSPEQRPADMQFADPEILTFDRGQKVEYIHLQPDLPVVTSRQDEIENRTAEAAADQIVSDTPEILGEDQIPLAVIPGWGATHRPFEDSMRYFSELGRSTLSASPMHRVEAERVDDYPVAVMKKVEALLLSLEEKGIEQVDAVGHSEGGMVLAIAAMIEPKRFRNLVFINPAGMIGKDNPIRLTKDFTKTYLNQMYMSLTDKEKRGKMVTTTLDGARTVISDPVGSIKEVLEISRTQIPDELMKLKERGHGIAIVHSTDDKTFPLARMQEVVGGGGGMTDGFAVVKGGHPEIYFQEKITKLVHLLLHNLQVKRKRGQRNGPQFSTQSVPI